MPGVDALARVVVVVEADVVAPVLAAGEGVLEAAVEVPFEARPVVEAEILEPADVRRPRAEVEAARMRVVEPALHRRLAGRFARCRGNRIG